MKQSKTQSRSARRPSRLRKTSKAVKSRTEVARASGPSAGGQKRPGTSVNEVYRTLYDRIISGAYPPRFKMSQHEIAKQLNVSRTPLREALNRLQANGLVVAGTNRGMEVAPIDNADAAEGYAARLLLEPPMVVGLLDSFTEGDLNAMEKALADMKRAGHRHAEFQKAHLRFHMVALLHYPKLIREIVLAIYDKIHRHQCIYFSRPRIPEDFTKLDEAFLEAIRARDALYVRQLLEFHLIDACIGMLLDIDPDHIPITLIRAARAIGIEFDIVPGQPLEHPVAMHWTRAAEPICLSTSNLVVANAGTPDDV